MSPEQIDGARYVDHRADLWSLAVIAFECMTGQRPFRGEGLRALFLAICVHERPLASSLCPVPQAFDAWFARSTDVDPAKRWRSATELAEELGRICHGATTLSAPATAEGASTRSSEDSTDSLSGSVAVSRLDRKDRPWPAGPDGSKERSGALRSPSARQRLPAFVVWGFFVLPLLGFGAWLSIGGTASVPARVNELFKSSVSPSLGEASSPSPSIGAPVVEPSGRTSAPDTSSFVRQQKLPEASSARPAHPRRHSGPKRTPEAQAPSPAPSTEPVPSPQSVPAAAPPVRKPEGWNYSEMLTDRK